MAIGLGKGPQEGKVVKGRENLKARENLKDGESKGPSIVYHLRLRVLRVFKSFEANSSEG